MNDPRCPLLSSDLDALARELTVQGDFQAAALLLMEKLANRPPPTSATVLQEWVALLTRQPGVAACAFLKADYDAQSLDPLASSPNISMLNALRSSPSRRRLLACLSNMQFLADRLPREASLRGRSSAQFFVQPLVPRSLRTLLIVVTDGTKAFQIDYIAQSVATFAAAFLAPAREQEMSARVAHMSSGSILVAQFKLEAALHELKQHNEPAAAGQICKALGALRDAQAGLDRARLLGLPWHKQARRIRLGPFLAEVAEALNNEIDQEVVGERSLRACRCAPDAVVRAGDERLRYALRDATLATWLLGKGRTTSLAVGRTGPWVSAQIKSQGTSLPRAAAGADLMAILSDPGQYLTLPDKPAARGIGFFLPRKLIEEMGGRMSAQIRGADRRLAITLDWPHV